MKDLGFLRYFLGIEVAYSSHGYLLSQQKYISDILARATTHDPAISTSASCTTPMELHLTLNRDDGSPLPHPTRYRELVVSLIYLTATRLDISQAVQVLSQFLHAPTTTHYAALLGVLRYLRSTITRSLFYSSDSPLTLRAYSDAGSQMIQPLINRPPGTVSSWALFSFLFGVRDSELSLDPALTQNIALWPTLP